MAAPTVVKALKPPSTKAAEKRWSPPELRMLLATLRSNLSNGETDIKCAELMGLDTADYNALKAEMYEQDKVEIHGKTVEQVFIDYSIKQEACMKDLDVLIKDSKTPRAAVVGAIRAKSDIIDKIIDRGQEFSLIDKAPEKKLLVAGVLVAQMDNKALRTMIVKQGVEMGKLLSKYGDEDLMAAEVPALPAKDAAGATLEVEAVPEHGSDPVRAPTFSALDKTGKATGGVVKAKGGKATVAARVKPFVKSASPRS